MEYINKYTVKYILSKLEKRNNIILSKYNLENLDLFIKLVAIMESDEIYDAQNPTTSANGLFQYVDAAFDTARRRMERAYDPEFVKSVFRNVKRLSDIISPIGQAQVLLGDLLERKGTDILLLNVMHDLDEKSIDILYYDYHHTNPDQATINRFENIKKKLGV